MRIRKCYSSYSILQVRKYSSNYSFSTPKQPKYLLDKLSLFERLIKSLSRCNLIASKFCTIGRFVCCQLLVKVYTHFYLKVPMAAPIGKIYFSIFASPFVHEPEHTAVMCHQTPKILHRAYIPTRTVFLPLNLCFQSKICSRDGRKNPGNSLLSTYANNLLETHHIFPKPDIIIPPHRLFCSSRTNAFFFL